MLDLYDDYVKGNVKVRDHCHITGKKKQVKKKVIKIMSMLLKFERHLQ